MAAAEPTHISDRGLKAACVVVSFVSFALQLQSVYGYPALLPVAMLLHVWVGPISLLAGGRQHHNFQLWQPFQGGPSFVAAQAAGWALYSTAILLGWCVLIAPTPASLGSNSFVGMLSISSALLLAGSANLFDPHAPAIASSAPTTGHRVTRVSVLLSTGGAMLLAAADVCRLVPAASVPSWATPLPEGAIALPLFGLISFSLSAALTHGLQAAPS
jgi:hypothetical protein